MVVVSSATLSVGGPAATVGTQVLTLAPSDSTMRGGVLVQPTGPTTGLPATATFSGVVYEGVGCRAKGDGSFAGMAAALGGAVALGVFG